MHNALISYNKQIQHHKQICNNDSSSEIQAILTQISHLILKKEKEYESVIISMQRENDICRNKLKHEREIRKEEQTKFEEILNNINSSNQKNEKLIKSVLIEIREEIKRFNQIL